MDIPRTINEVIDRVYSQTKPVSIFVYGSRARGDHLKDSDYEVGVLFERGKKWGRKELSQLHTLNNLNLYPFIYEDILRYSLDTPFPRAVFLRELAGSAITVKGTGVIEGMKLSAVKVSDLLEVVTFQLAYALGAVLSSRQGDWVTASTEFIKSVLYGARALIILETKKFPLLYEEMAEASLELNIEQRFKDLIRHTVKVRSGAKIDPVQLYTNITFLNQVVLNRVKDELKRGDKVLLKGRKI